MTQIQGTYTGKAIGAFLDNLVDSGDFRRYIFNIVTRICGGKKTIEFSSRKMIKLERGDGGYSLTFAPAEESAADWGSWNFVWSETGTTSGRQILELSVTGVAMLQ